MSRREKRQKAQDVFNETDFLLSSKGTFDDGFPTIDTIRVQVEEIGHGVDAEYNKRTYTKAHFPGEYVNCSNSLCYNGGFSLGEILRDMVSRLQMEKSAFKTCQGYKGSPKGRRNYGPCGNYFKVQVRLTYKNEDVAKKAQGESN
jgi:hypothetical protein